MIFSGDTIPTSSFFEGLQKCRCLAWTNTSFQTEFIEDLVAPSQVFRALIFQGKRQ
jgi:hypothetical protein